MSETAGTRWFARPERGLIEVRGSDRESWLNGMVSNELPPEAGGWRHAAILTPKGRVVADLYLLRMGDDLFLELERGFVEATIAHLERYVIADDVTLVDRGREFLHLAIEGPEARGALARAIPDVSPEIATSLQAGGASRLPFANAELGVAGYGFGSSETFQLFAASELESKLRAALVEAGVEEGSADELETRRIEAGVPRLGRELDDGVLPDEARLDDAISTTKGCYTGQEIVARLRSRAQVQHLLVGLVLEELPSPEVDISQLAIEVDGKRSGELTSVARSAAFGSIALGFVRRAHASVGLGVTVVGDGPGIAATVAALPFGAASAEGTALAPADPEASGEE